MFKIDETKIDLEVEVKNVDGETKTYNAKAPSSKKFFDGLNKLNKAQEKLYGKSEIPVGALNAAAIAVVYEMDIDWLRDNFSDFTLNEWSKFLVKALLESKKK